MNSEAAFVKEQLKRVRKGPAKYPADYVARESYLIKRKSMLPVPPACLMPTDTGPTTVKAPSVQETTLTIKTLGGKAYKLQIRLVECSCASLHAQIRSLCDIPSSSNIRLLRQGRVIPDSDQELANYIPDPSVPLNLIEQQAQHPKKMELGEPFFKDFDQLLSKHVQDNAARERIKKGFREHYEQWLG